MNTSPSPSPSDDDLSRRSRLRDLVQKHFYGNNSAAAYAIERVSGRSVTPRALQTWTTLRRRVSSRPCPEWAVQALIQYVADPAHQRALELEAEFARRPMSDPVARAVDDDNRRGVDVAGIYVAWERKTAEEWDTTTLVNLPRRIFELERSLRDELESVQAHLDALRQAICEGTSVEEIQSLAKRHERAVHYTHAMRRKTMRALSTGEDL